MTVYRAFNNGLSVQAMPDGYAAQSGETLFSAAPTPAQLAAAFPAYAAAQLLLYANQKQSAAIGAGLSVNVGSGSAPQNVAVSTDAQSLVLLNGAYALAQANSAATFQWVQPSGVAVTLSAAQIITIFNAVAQAVQQTFSILTATIAGINATPPTITTTAQIDAAFAAA